MDGPYVDLRVILEPGVDSDPWEGLQGTDSFFMYPANGRWYAFFGGARTEHWPCNFWGVGLATAPDMAGPWKCCSNLNPVDLENKFAENPVVTKLENGLYIAVVDGGGINEKFGYTLSKDGINWSKAYFIDLEPQVEKWWSLMRTPLGLISEGNNEYTLFFTAIVDADENHKHKLIKSNSGYGALGVVRLLLNASDNKLKELL